MVAELSAKEAELGTITAELASSSGSDADTVAKLAQTQREVLAVRQRLNLATAAERHLAAEVAELKKVESQCAAARNAILGYGGIPSPPPPCLRIRPLREQI